MFTGLPKSRISVKLWCSIFNSGMLVKTLSKSLTTFCRWVLWAFAKPWRTFHERSLVCPAMITSFCPGLQRTSGRGPVPVFLHGQVKLWRHSSANGACVGCRDKCSQICSGNKVSFATFCQNYFFTPDMCALLLNAHVWDDANLPTLENRTLTCHQTWLAWSRRGNTEGRARFWKPLEDASYEHQKRWGAQRRDRCRWSGADTELSLWPALVAGSSFGRKSVASGLCFRTEDEVELTSATDWIALVDVFWVVLNERACCCGEFEILLERQRSFMKLCRFVAICTRRNASRRVCSDYKKKDCRLGVSLHGQVFQFPPPNFRRTRRVSNVWLKCLGRCAQITEWMRIVLLTIMRFISVHTMHRLGLFDRFGDWQSCWEHVTGSNGIVSGRRCARGVDNIFSNDNKCCMFQQCTKDKKQVETVFHQCKRTTRFRRSRENTYN